MPTTHELADQLLDAIDNGMPVDEAVEAAINEAPAKGPRMIRFGTSKERLGARPIAQARQQ